MSGRVVDAGGARISWDEVGEGPDLVILHSLLTDRHAFDALVPALASRRRVHLIDLPGFGQSTRVAGGIDAYADAIGHFLEAADLDPSHTSLLGNGLGAFVALGTAIRHGSRFDRLGLVGCGVAFPPAARETFAGMAQAVEQGGMEAVVEAALRRIFPDAYLARHPEAAEERRRVLRRTDPEAFAAACRALQLLDYRADAPTVSNPTYVLVGSEDTATPPAMAREAHGLIPSSELVVLDGVGHAPQLQGPTQLLAALEGFLGDDPGGAG